MSKQIPKAPKDLALCPFQKFVVERWDRRKIKNAPYNPRTISKDAQKRLAAKIKKRGLLQAVTVNATTCNLVGGHKRLAILDALMGTSAYLLDVCVVKLTPKQEREENVAFNNPALAGDWDLAALADVLPGLDLEETGFEALELEALLGTQGKGLFSEEEQPPEVQDVVDDLDEMAGAREEEAAAAKDRRQKMQTPRERVGEPFPVGDPFDARALADQAFAVRAFHLGAILKLR
jgi:ParB-like chromosome segregation protein Spo0J